MNVIDVSDAAYNVSVIIWGASPAERRFAPTGLGSSTQPKEKRIKNEILRKERIGYGLNFTFFPATVIITKKMKIGLKTCCECPNRNYCFNKSLYRLIYLRAEFSHEKSRLMPFRMIFFHSSGCWYTLRAR